MPRDTTAADLLRTYPGLTAEEAQHFKVCFVTDLNGAVQLRTPSLLGPIRERNPALAAEVSRRAMASLPPLRPNAGEDERLARAGQQLAAIGLPADTQIRSADARWTPPSFDDENSAQRTGPVDGRDGAGLVAVRPRTDEERCLAAEQQAEAMQAAFNRGVAR